MMQAVPGLWVWVHLGVTDSTFARPVDKLLANLVPSRWSTRSRFLTPRVVFPVYSRVFFVVFGILDLPVGVSM